MQTALTTKLSQAIIDMVGTNLVPVLTISAVIAIIAGMELPTPAACVIMFVTAVPLMIDAGVDIYAANFFAFYFVILSSLTPPVVHSVLAASRLADGGFLEASKHSLRQSIVGYLLPFTMAFTPQTLGFPDKIGAVGWTAIAVLLFVFNHTTAYPFAFGGLLTAGLAIAVLACRPAPATEAQSAGE